MKTCFIVHGSFGNNKEHYLPWLKGSLEKLGFKVIMPSYPIGVGVQCYEAWKKVLDQHKKLIDENTIFVGRSIAPIFIVKYILENNLHIKALYSISGFNNAFIDHGEYDSVNESFYVKDITGFKNLCDKRLCIISENDPFVKYDYLIGFAKDISAEVLNIKDGGHFNTDSGYTKFEKLLEIIKKDNKL